MRITILAVGTRGDIQPFAALGLGLKQAGHEVTLAAGTNFETFVLEQGLHYAPLRADYYELIDSDEGKAMIGGNPLMIMQKMKTLIFPLMRRLLDDSWAASQNADAVIYHPKVLGGLHIAEKLNIPAFVGMTVPLLIPTTAFPAPGVASRNLGGFLNKLSFAAVSSVESFFGGMIKDWRKNVLGLPEKSPVVKGYTLHGKHVPVLYCYSQHVVPFPTDWPDYAHVTGYWFLDTSVQQAPADLVQFIEAGTPPVYVGFGSMAGRDPQRTTEIVLEALAKSGQRGIIATGWGGLTKADLPAQVFQVQEVPHEWLFPRMAAVVHHGGAGTTAAGLRAGKPTVICPFMADQPFWGNRIHQLGVGTAPIPQKKLTADLLADAIKTATSDEGIRQRAEVLGEKIRAERGVTNAVDVVNRYLTHGEPEKAKTIHG